MKRRKGIETPSIQSDTAIKKDGLKEEKKEIKQNGQNNSKTTLKIKIVRKETEKVKSSWEKFQERIPYALTYGQKKAIDDVNADMDSTEIMDRVIIAPVGAGKTEVAMHAAFKAIQSGKQVIILSPRCELARQHFVKFQERFEGIAKVVHIPSSYTKSEKNWAYSKIKKGEFNVIVGTHGLLTNACKYRNLGLTIIDEEQAFGVKQKEFLSNKYPDAHTLILTATPIPRTQELIKLDYYKSTEIETLPQGRLPIEVELSPDINTSLDSIKREKERGGQTFFVTSKIATIPYLESFLKENCSDIRYKMLYGKMKDNEQTETLQQFREGAFDVLLSTNIIGVGIDIPTANTIIIDNANKFGLGDLYQMKGRVGRGSTQGYALLLYDEAKIKANALAKLQAIKKFSGLNDCKKISEIDLELRGGGDVLNTDQHGHKKNQSAQILEAYLKSTNRDPLPGIM